MAGFKFHIVDVFAESKYAGNQLAVVLDAGALASDRMQQIARETNFAETTFVLSSEPRDGGWDVRIFTPREEVPFAGHPTLGTSFVIREEFLGPTAERVALNLGVGRIPVRFHRSEDGSEVLWMQQKPPEFGATVDPATIARVLGLDAGDIDDRYPVQHVSTGLPFLLVPVKSLGAVRRARLVADRYAEAIRDHDAKAIFFFCREALDPENQIHARMFAEHFGVPEDPATGSANGCLAGYLVRHRVLDGDSIDVRVEQGYSIQRPSLLRLNARENDGRIEVSVGGKVVPVARGELL